MPSNSGVVKTIQGNPRGFTIQPPGDPLPATIAYTSDVDSESWQIAFQAWKDGTSVTCTGTPPAAGTVSASK